LNRSKISKFVENFFIKISTNIEIPITFFKLYFTKVSTLFHTNYNINDEKTGDFSNQINRKRLRVIIQKQVRKKTKFRKIFGLEKNFSSVTMIDCLWSDVSR